MKYGLGYTLITRITAFLARTIFHFRKAEIDYIINFLGQKKGCSILDFGCNTGYLLDMIAKKHGENYCTLSGADINPHALRTARNYYPQFTFYNIDDAFLKAHRQSFDVIILSHVLEHVHEREQLIQQLRSLLTEEGNIIIVVPQERIRGDCTVVQLLFNYLCLRFENPHVVRLHYSDIEKLVSKVGMRIAKHRYIHFFPPCTSQHKRIDSWSLVSVVGKAL